MKSAGRILYVVQNKGNIWYFSNIAKLTCWFLYQSWTYKEHYCTKISVFLPQVNLSKLCFSAIYCCHCVRALKRFPIMWVVMKRFGRWNVLARQSQVQYILSVQMLKLQCNATQCYWSSIITSVQILSNTRQSSSRTYKYISSNAHCPVGIKFTMQDNIWHCF